MTLIWCVPGYNEHAKWMRFAQFIINMANNIRFFPVGTFFNTARFSFDLLWEQNKNGKYKLCEIDDDILTRNVIFVLPFLLHLNDFDWRMVFPYLLIIEYFHRKLIRNYVISFREVDFSNLNVNVIEMKEI